MRRRLAATALLLVLVVVGPWIVSFAPRAGPLVLGADQGPRTNAAPHRIVCFIPAVTQMLFAIGAGPQVVAVGTYDHDPPEVLKLPRVGGLLDPDSERILSLKPDLVVVYDGQQELVARLEAAHVPLFLYKHGDLASVTRTMRDLGRAVGHAPEAEDAASRIEARLRGIAARVASRPRPLALLVFGREPHSLRGIDASGGYGFLHDMLLVAGARDVFADVKREAVQPSIEQILARRPEAIIELRYGASAGTSDGMAPWRRLASVPAVRDGRLYKLTGDDFVEAGPHVAEATEKLSRVLHPEAWR